MRTFTDTTGRAWQLIVNVNTVARVRAEHDVNLLALPDDNWALLQRLSADPVLLVAVLYVVCQRQAENESVSEEAFGAALFGDPLGEAVEQLIREVVAFFPDRRRREALTAIVEKGKAVGEAMLDRATGELGKLAEMDPETILDQWARENAPTGSAGSTPASSE